MWSNGVMNNEIIIMKNNNDNVKNDKHDNKVKIMIIMKW